MINRYLKYILIAGIYCVITSCNTNYKRKPIEEKQFTSGKYRSYDHGAIVRGDSTVKNIAIVFTGDEFGDGGRFISETLEKNGIVASFFLTGNFYRNIEFREIVDKLRDNGNYLGSHSDKHLLYCDWENRDSLLVTKNEFLSDIDNSYYEMGRLGIRKEESVYFLPPYEWYNDSIASWTNECGLCLVNFTPGTRSNADYTYPEMGKQYVDSKTIYNSIISFEKESKTGLNGFILLIHISTDPRRTDKFYFLLPHMIEDLKKNGYNFVRIDTLLK